MSNKRKFAAECESCLYLTACEDVLASSMRVLCQVPVSISQETIDELKSKKPKCEADPDHGLGDYGWVASEGQPHPLCKPCWDAYKRGPWDEVGVFSTDYTPARGVKK